MSKYRIVKQNKPSISGYFEFTYSIQKESFFGWKQVDFTYIERDALEKMKEIARKKTTKDEVIYETEI